MRKLLCLLLAVAALTAGAARADVGPPVQVRILGEPRAAEAGVPFKGQLQFTTTEPLTLDNMMFNGTGWSQLALDAGPQMTLDKKGPQVVDFEVLTGNPSQPLELSFMVGDFPVKRYFDLSPAGVAMARGPGALEKVADQTDVPELTESTRVSPAPAPGKDPLAPAPDSAAKSRNIRVHGRFVYVRSDGWTIGADGLTVRVYDSNSPFAASQLAVVATDAQGWYDVTFSWSSGIFDSDPDIYLHFETSNSRVQVESPTWLSGAYSWETGTTNDYTGSDINYGTLQPSDINQHPAVHLQTNLTRTWRWWTGYGYDTPMVHGNWPNGTGGAFYNGEIYVSTGEQWNENVASHEYGHHWVANYALSPAPSYCNGVCDAPDNCGHCIWCAETTNISFTEGFPDWMGDVIPGSFGASYGRAAMAIYNMENLSTCGGGWADPTMTEGFLGAVVRDIGDATNDNEASFPETDELSLGYGPAITCVDLDTPVTATAFLTAFKNRYPAYREGLWATAKNDGYEIDTAPPPAVTNLISTSHTVGVSSPDPTIDFTWTRAYDDASGVRGYSIMIAGGIGLPLPSQDITDVTSYTTPALAPGTYYFSIRTKDRTEKWSTTYAWAGPYIVRAPLPSNLAYYQFPGWNKVLVPRATNDATFGSVTAPTTLAGNASSTYWNVGLWNSGESANESGFYIHLNVDDVWSWWMYSGALGAYGGQYGINAGPVNIRGGRHTFEAVLDATELVAETNEGDNRWAHQWVWTPQALTPNTATTRVAPPLRTAGWSSVTDGSTLYYNSDGLQMNATSWWDVTVLRPLTATTDDDLYMYAPTTNADTGFASYLTASARGTGGIDAVIANRNVVGWSNYDVGVINWNGNASNYAVTHTTNYSLAFGDSVTVPFAQDQMLRVWEFYVGAAQVGPVSITVDVAPGDGPVTALWLDKNFTTGGLSSYSAAATSNAAGRARLDLTIPDAGYNGLVVYRDPSWSKTTGPINVTIELNKTPPDFMPLYASGWHAPLVPRAAFDGTGASTPAPTTLPGNVNSTYFNFAVRNNSPSAAASLPSQVYVDGVYSAWVVWGAFPALTDATFNWGAPWTIRGGRHTLAMKLDANNEYEEMYEDNNIFGEQWVWSPLDLVNDTPVVRSDPPDAYGDWTNVTTGEPTYPNCDGLRMPNVGGFWRAVAAMPGVNSDVDVRLHASSTGAKSGFAANLAGSYYSQGTPDYVLVDFNIAPGGYQTYDAGIVHYSGGENYTAESTASGTWISYPNGTYGPYSLPANRILNLVEVYLPAGQTGIHLTNLSGNVDWGLALHPATLSYQGRGDAMAVSEYGIGHGQDELLNVTVPTAGYYCVAVYRRNAADMAQAGSYNLVMKPMWASGVGNDLPAPSKTALLDITPNPFNPQTKITYELAGDSQVQLQVYDLKGHLVRTLVNASRTTGRHTETWDGSDDGGGKVASGLYMARLTAGGVTQMMKMTLLK